MSELEIIGVPQSNFVRTVRIACEEKQVPYRLTPGRPRSPEVKAIHPLGKIPVMRHGERASFKATVPPPFSELRQPAAAVRPGNP
jgi:glutathione S-transferase